MGSRIQLAEGSARLTGSAHACNVSSEKLNLEDSRDIFWISTVILACEQSKISGYYYKPGILYSHRAVSYSSIL